MARVALDPNRLSSQAQSFKDSMERKIHGQKRAVDTVSKIYGLCLANLEAKGRPMWSSLLLGPTGSGKTRFVEAVAETLFGTADAVVKVDCAEFQHSHEIAKLIGSPPGYLGHRETRPFFTQETLNRSHTDKTKLTILLFDEIEKASPALWKLLLGILDKGQLTLGDNRKVDFSRCLIFMTSNLGANQMIEVAQGGIGFAPPPATSMGETNADQKIYQVCMEAARRNFDPEFMNRLDKVLVFRTLDEDTLHAILNTELNRSLHRRILWIPEVPNFIFDCTQRAKNALLQEGFDPRYGARHVNRAIERFIFTPLSNLVSTGNIKYGDFVVIDYDLRTKKFIFSKEPGQALLRYPAVFAHKKKP